ncbi:MAG: Maf family nucleotide pyrophosphatase [Deltaproteobacteria bacterium]|jgi:septum formation protein|nr:Maf family nucleotide pyrophosphatase [Deltaproteobacteria bacterium]
MRRPASPIPQGAFYAALPLVLASASPRRRDFLRLLGLEFDIVRPKGAEPQPLTGENPADYALRAAQAKAFAAAQARPDAFVLGADTVVALEGEILGKPRDRRHALDMLLRLSGKSHVVISACCCYLPDGTARHTAGEARVHFFPWPRDVLAAYAATDEVRDKAGAYAVQGRGAFLAQGIEGSVSAVVGLPMAQLASLLSELGVIRAHAALPA